MQIKQFPKFLKLKIAQEPPEFAYLKCVSNYIKNSATLTSRKKNYEPEHEHVISQKNCFSSKTRTNRLLASEFLQLRQFSFSRDPRSQSARYHHEHAGKKKGSRAGGAALHRQKLSIRHIFRRTSIGRPA